MKRFKNVLVVYDDAIGGDDALGQAATIARENAARLTIATVLGERQHRSLIADEVKKRLERLVFSVRCGGIADVSGVILTGIPFLEITRRVIRARHDLVIISAEAGRILRDVFFGSTATHLMRKCPCPVWVVKPNQPVPYTKILAAVDPQRSADEEDLNVKIMDLATALASRDHAALHIVHAWEVDGKDFDTVKSELSPHQRQALIRRHKRKNRSAVNNLLARYSMFDIDHHVHMPRDLPARAICRLAEKEKIDLIVMGTVVRTGIPGFFIGNTAETILGSAKCGVLTVKPDGFETPIMLPQPFEGESRVFEADDDPARRIA